MQGSSVELVSTLFDLSEEFTECSGTVKGNDLLNAAKKLANGSGSNLNLTMKGGTISRTGT